MATSSSDASTVAMDASQLVVEAEVHTNETLERDLNEQISPVDSDKVLYNEDPDEEYREHRRRCEYVNYKFTGAHIRTPSKQSGRSLADCRDETYEFYDLEKRPRQSFTGQGEQQTHDLTRLHNVTTQLRLWVTVVYLHPIGGVYPPQRPGQLLHTPFL